PSVHGPFERERVEERDGVLVAVDGEMAVGEADHRDALSHEARGGEQGATGGEGEGGVGVSQVVEVAQRFDAECLLDWLPVPSVEVAEVEVSAAAVRKQQLGCRPA